VNRWRWALVVLLAASTAVFGVAVASERSTEDEHVERVADRPGVEGASHDEGEEFATAEAEEHADAEQESHGDEEQLLGVDLESTWLVALGVAFGFALVALAATAAGRTHVFLVAVVVICIGWAALDVRELVHLLEDSETGLAVLATLVAFLHVAAALVAGRLLRPTAVSP
jgi:hypothetical protein